MGEKMRFQYSTSFTNACKEVQLLKIVFLYCAFSLTWAKEQTRSAFRQNKYFGCFLIMKKSGGSETSSFIFSRWIRKSITRKGSLFSEWSSSNASKTTLYNNCCWTVKSNAAHVSKYTFPRNFHSVTWSTFAIIYLVNGSSKLTNTTDGQLKSPSSGYHPPLPPKPRQLAKSRESLLAKTPTAVEVSADEAVLIRELLYVFQVRLQFENNDSKQRTCWQDNYKIHRV